MTTPHGFSTTRIMLENECGAPELGRTEYMRRWIFSCPWFTIRLHHIKESDYGWPHNHPWNFLTLILAGGYTELLYTVFNTTAPCAVVNRKPGSLRKRKTTDIHKVMLHPGQTAWTLCITDGPRMHDGHARWGFFTPEGYIHWHVYDPQATEEV